MSLCLKRNRFCSANDFDYFLKFLYSVVCRLSVCHVCTLIACLYITSATSLFTFRHKLKTFLFRRSYGV